MLSKVSVMTCDTSCCRCSSRRSGCRRQRQSTWVGSSHRVQNAHQSAAMLVLPHAPPLLLSVAAALARSHTAKPGLRPAACVTPQQHAGTLALAAITTSLFYPVSKTAGQLMLPYLAWLAFANLLNIAIIRMNGTRVGSTADLCMLCTTPCSLLRATCSGRAVSADQDGYGGHAAWGRQVQPRCPHACSATAGSHRLLCLQHHHYLPA